MNVMGKKQHGKRTPRSDRLAAGTPAKGPSTSASPPTNKNVGRPERYYRTDLGTAWLGDAAEVLNTVATGSVQAIITSPPFALRRKKRYGNRAEHEYVPWFMSFVDQFK